MSWLKLGGNAVQVMSYVYKKSPTDCRLNASSACATAAGLNPGDIDTGVSDPGVRATRTQSRLHQQSAHPSSHVRTWH